MLNTARSAGAPSASSAIALSHRAMTSASFVPSTVTGVAEPPAGADRRRRPSDLGGGAAGDQHVVALFRKAAAGGGAEAAFRADAQHDGFRLLCHVQSSQRRCGVELAVRASGFATVRPHEITSLPHDRTRSRRAVRPAPRHRAAGLDRLERPHERRLLRRRLRQGDRHAVQPVRLRLGIHARQDRHDLRARGARHLRPRGQGRRPAAHHQPDPRPRRQAPALHPRHVPRDRRLSRRDQRADADEHRLRDAPVGAVARMGAWNASTGSRPRTSPCPCPGRPAA